MRIHKRSSNLIRSLLALILSLSMVIACAPVQITAYAADGSSTHNIAIASDRHGNEEAVGSAFSGMPTDMEYVCLGGDMVDKGEYDSSMLLGEGGVKGRRKSALFDCFMLKACNEHQVRF